MSWESGGGGGGFGGGGGVLNGLKVEVLSESRP